MSDASATVPSGLAFVCQACPVQRRAMFRAT
jgi:hypothetical protein